ncbi:hypothetical protein [Alloprevotella tannerae]|jgi:hypothetical protein|nr:hypothetical protein [Alloprevotella tannerae]
MQEKRGKKIHKNPIINTHYFIWCREALFLNQSQRIFAIFEQEGRL